MPALRDVQTLEGGFLVAFVSHGSCVCIDCLWSLCACMLVEEHLNGYDDDDDDDLFVCCCPPILCRGASCFDSRLGG